MISYEYLDFLRRKIMEKVIAKEIRTCKKEEKEDKWAKQVVELGSTTKQVVQKTTKKHVKTQFTTTRILATIVEVGNHFHHNFQAGFWIDP